ncbi:ankyrin, partial [Wilcoxina mikolae CBS 423.85]
MNDAEQREHATKLLLSVTDLSPPTNDSKWLPFHAAVNTGSLYLAELLAKRQWGDPSLPNHEGYTALHIAVTKGDMNFASWLLDYGVEPNILGEWNVTALHLAVKKGNSRLVSFLLDKGANPNIPDFDDELPLHYAVS